MSSNLILILNITIQGFLLSRLILNTGLAEKVVSLMLEKTRGDLRKIYFFSFLISCMGSMLISNVVFMLNMLPILRSLDKAFRKMHSYQPIQSNVLTILIIFGCNIGSIGTISGSPLQVTVLATMVFAHIPLSNQLDFFTWSLIGIPIVLTYVTVIFFLIYLFTPKKYRFVDTSSGLGEVQNIDPFLYKHSFGVVVYTVLSWITFSIFDFFLPQSQFLHILSSLMTLVLLMIIFYIPVYHENQRRYLRLLKFSDLWNNLPWRSFLFLVLALGIGITSLHFISGKFESFLVKILDTQQNIPFLVFLVFGLLVMFISEMVSNFGIVLIFTSVIIKAYQLTGMDVLGLILAITMLGNVPSMLPTASPVNALAYGSSKSNMFRYIISLGFVGNIISLSIILPFIYFYLPLVLKWIT